MAETNGEILQNWQIDYLESYLRRGREDMNSGLIHLTQLIEQFENEPVVQSFFTAGNFGQEEKEKLEKLIELINKEKDNIGDTLIPATEEYFKNQRSYNDGGVK